MQVCNFSGYLEPSTVSSWGLVDFDWENARGDRVASGGWMRAKPMDCGERMVQQVEMQVASYQQSGSKYMIYRNFVKALPWLSVVRAKLVDPAFSSWFLNFSAAVQQNHSLSHVPVCDESYSPPLCTHLYHDQVLTPQHAQCGGTPPRCDTGAVPAGEYLFDFTAANLSINGQTMVEWFVDEYMLGNGGAGHPHIVGYYIDDGWDADSTRGGKGPSECDSHWQADTGMDDAHVDSQIAAFRWVADKVYAAMLAAGKFNWNQFLNNDPYCPACGNCPGPWVRQATCAADLRTHCNATGPVHTRAMHYGIRGCGGARGDTAANLSDIGPHVASFLLVRGEYAYLSMGWGGCATLGDEHPYGWNEQWLDADYGVPVDEVCKETAPGVFVREWSKATVQLDCKTWTPRVAFKVESIKQ